MDVHALKLSEFRSNVFVRVLKNNGIAGSMDLGKLTTIEFETTKSWPITAACNH